MLTAVSGEVGVHFHHLISRRVGNTVWSVKDAVDKLKHSTKLYAGIIIINQIKLKVTLYLSIYHQIWKYSSIKF